MCSLFDYYIIYICRMDQEKINSVNENVSPGHTHGVAGGELRSSQFFTLLASSIGASILTVLLVGSIVFAHRDAILGDKTIPNPSSAVGEVGEVRSALRAHEPVVDVVARVSDAVVSVVITKDVPVLEKYYETIDPFEGWGFFGGSQIQVPRVRERGTEEREVGGGTGFFVSDSGLLVTNRHVVRDADARYSVITNNGESFEAEVLVRDSQFDIAILKVKDIPTETYSYLTFGDSDALMPGQTVIAIGNALTEFRNSVSVGVISGLSRSITAGSRYGRDAELLDGVIQTDAAINPGNSGGPLLNLSGEVIGVNVAVAGGAENIGFSIPANLVASAVESVETYGEIRRPYLGVRYIELNEAIAGNNELPVSYGAWLKGGIEGPAVAKNSPAQRAGLQENDIILSFDGTSLKEDSKEYTLATLVRKKRVGDTVEVAFMRGVEERTTRIVLEQFPDVGE
jgi:serine protease Do